MKRYSTAIFLLLICFFPVVAQNTILVSGKCNADVKWTFDGFTLQLDNISKRGLPAEIPDYDIKTYTAPWIKKKLNVKTIKIGQGISRIGSCAFANCKSVQEVIFEGLDLVDIAWGAFLGCTRLKTISLPVQLENIGKIAFANCSQIPSISIPDRCRVGDMAFVSCTGLQSIEIGSTTILGGKWRARPSTIPTTAKSDASRPMSTPETAWDLVCRWQRWRIIRSGPRVSKQSSKTWLHLL